MLAGTKRSVVLNLYFDQLCVRSVAGYKGQVRRFRTGLDYTVAHYGILTQKAVLDATICFAAGTGGIPVSPDDATKPENGGNQNSGDSGGAEDDEPDEADVLWQSDDVGGFECYIEASDYENNFTRDGDANEKTVLEEGNNTTASSEAADEYNEDDDTNLLSVSACNNTLSLVYRDPGTMRFIKYVGSRAPSSRWDICMEYQVPDDEDDASNEKAIKK